MASVSDIKQVLLTGSAATEVTGTSTTKRGNRKKRGGEGNNTLPVLPSSPTPSPTPSPSPSPSPVLPSPSPAPTPVLPSPSPSPVLLASTPAPVIEGGSKIIKVELKKRSTAKRVHLQPKRTEMLSAQKKTQVGQTKKARKVTLAVKSLHTRMKRAKKMTRKVKEMSLPHLREHLIQKKLIKPTSKAPESVLRQIAADAQIVAGKAL